MTRPRIPRCANCNAPLSGARTIINNQWTCPTCTYAYDYPDREIAEPIPDPRSVKAPLQKETLFPLSSVERD